MGASPSSLIEIACPSAEGETSRGLLLSKLQTQPQLLSTSTSVLSHNTSGTTALHLACEMKQVQVVQVIISFLSTASPATVRAALQPYCRRMGRPMPSTVTEGVRTAVDMINCKGQTPLMIACAAGSPELVKLLLTQGADPWASDFCGSRCALHYAAMSGHAACIEALMSNIRLQDMAREGVRYVNVRTRCGISALHYVAYFDHLAALEELLRHEPQVNAASRGYSYDVLVTCDVGCMPLHFAAMRGHIAIARRILEHQCCSNNREADARTRRNDDGEMPWQVAATHHPSQRELVALLHPGQPLERALGLGLGLAADGSLAVAPGRKGPLPLATLATAALQAKLLAEIRGLQEKDEDEVDGSLAANGTGPGRSLYSASDANHRLQSKPVAAPRAPMSLSPSRSPHAAAVQASGAGASCSSEKLAPPPRPAQPLGLIADDDDDDDEEGLCGVCFARREEVAPAGCGHGLCGRCAAEMCRGMLAASRPKALSCPFCRRDVGSFVVAAAAMGAGTAAGRSAGGVA